MTVARAETVTGTERTTEREEKEDDEDPVHDMTSFGPWAL
jgi:hypothetical protein